MRPRVKICGITCADDALSAAAAGADAIGLVFWPRSPRAVDLAAAAAIVRALPPFVAAVGLFVDPEPAHVRAVVEAVALAFLQFHGDETPAFCAAFGYPYLKAVRMEPGVDLLQSAIRFREASALLVDAHEPGGMPGGTGKTFEWDRIARDVPHRIVLSGGLTPRNVGAAVDRVRPWAVDVSSGVEADDVHGRPLKRRKDPAKVAAFVAAVMLAADRAVESP